ncbi:uncharacterized protein L969DRAFT_243275 [Mixia osmundae IAM 14324]|uniref:Uncharacterized protein n=1 Tax=Mixia osmundae (strain CBS 9802 / IAM 14324 / JCM 22182 / KY 12970) TaxID=764103 RepID=G7E1H4_MIXOS|nr:uncharacterized protein L969DRAFT_243275 [Mixia osmundae IAM 14324]KEI36638.1 hypothetical protein L969DRAFT_243275 [Mixia osmundae IAM 14324]GAA96684.1 hypothetical protein E5Q_03355 [Mixia osmundae IAM 14324]
MSGISSAEYARRKDKTQAAYELQVKGAKEGALRWTVYALGLVTAAHFTFPGFARQTLAGKAFLVSSASIFGMVTWADHYLLHYESEQKESERAMRTLAMADIAGAGGVATETEIRRWQERRRAAKPVA